MLSKLRTLPFKQILVALLLGDLLFIFLHILHITPEEIITAFSDPAFSLTQDHGVGEAYQYVKEFWLAILFFLLSFRFRKFAYLGWGVVFTFFLLDDMIRIHEAAGEFFGNIYAGTAYFQSHPDLPARNIGELTFFGGLGILILTLVSIPYFRSGRETRQNFHIIFLLLLAFAFFGGVVDFIDRLVNIGHIIDLMFEILEDGGELIPMSALCWYGYVLFNRETGTSQDVTS